MPSPIWPMLAKESSTIEQALEVIPYAWADEKLDGFRMILSTVGSPVAWTRQGNRLSLPPHLLAAAKELPEDSIYDGELIHGTGTHISDRRALQSEIGLETHFAVFDLLECEGHDLKGYPLHMRKELLDTIFDTDRSAPMFVLKGGLVTEDIHPVLDELFTLREGVIIKDADSAYCPGKRVGFWRKVLNPNYGKVVP